MLLVLALSSSAGPGLGAGAAAVRARRPGGGIRRKPRGVTMPSPAAGPAQGGDGRDLVGRLPASWRPPAPAGARAAVVCAPGAGVSWRCCCSSPPSSPSACSGPRCERAGRRSLAARRSSRCCWPAACSRWSLDAERRGLHARATSGRPPTASSCMAQAVPTSSWVPCLEGMPLGWHFSGHGRSTAGSARFWLDSDRDGMRAYRDPARLEACFTSAWATGDPERPARGEAPGCERVEPGAALMYIGRALLPVRRRLHHPSSSGSPARTAASRWRSPRRGSVLSRATTCGRWCTRTAGGRLDLDP